MKSQNTRGLSSEKIPFGGVIFSGGERIYVSRQALHVFYTKSQSSKWERENSKTTMPCGQARERCGGRPIRQERGGSPHQDKMRAVVSHTVSIKSSAGHKQAESIFV